MHLVPLETMSFEEKLNAMTRLVIIMTLLGYLITKKKKIYNYWNNYNISNHFSL